MPIRPDIRHLYRGPVWEATRKRILDRAGNCCEGCGKPNGARVFTYTWKSRDPEFGGRVRYHMVWIRDASEGRKEKWRDEFGYPVSKRHWPAPGLPRRIRAQLGVAHVDNNPANMDDSNLRAWCNWCHLHADSTHHRQTRGARKDATRPVLQVAS